MAIRISEQPAEFMADLINQHDYLETTSPVQTGLYIPQSYPSVPPGAAAAAIPSLANWQRLWLLPSEMDRVRSFVSECTDIYKKYSDKQEGKTTAVKDKMHIKISDFKVFFQPILNRMSGNPYITVDDLREFHIKAGQLKDNNPTKTRVQAIEAPDFSLVSITSGDFVGRIRPTKKSKRASKS